MSLKTLVNYDDPNSFASRLRKKRSRYLEEVISAIASRNGSCRILDLGGTHAYWNIFPETWFENLSIKITLLNLNRVSIPERANTRFCSVSGDACNLSEYADDAFDLVHSNSVIEHVGSWDRMCSMAKESLRVGKRVYLQTPYFWFPVEPHFLTPFVHWLPLSVRAWLACKVAMGNWPRATSIDEAVRAQQSSMLLDKRMLQSMMPAASIRFERFLGLPKSLIAIA
ncbi:MAG: class I SAM-dependent methyltransferase [Pseudomonadota bacterium]